MTFKIINNSTLRNKLIKININVIQIPKAVIEILKNK